MVMSRYYSSDAPATTLASSLTTTAASASVASATGLPSSFPFSLWIDLGLSSQELVEVTAVSGTTLTITRGADGSTGGAGGVAHASGAQVVHGPSAQDFYDRSWNPSWNSLALAAWDPALSLNAVAPVAGALYLVQLQAWQNVTLNYLWVLVNSAGAGTSSGSYVGLYSSSGTRLAESADIGSHLTSGTGPQQLSLTSPATLTAGSFAWAAILVNLATTQPSLTTAGYTANACAGLTAANARFAYNGLSLTSLPSSITPSSNVISGAGTFWAGAN